MHSHNYLFTFFGKANCLLQRQIDKNLQGYSLRVLQSTVLNILHYVSSHQIREHLLADMQHEVKILNKDLQ